MNSINRPPSRSVCKTIKPNDKLRHDGFFFFSSFEWMCGLFNALHQTLLAQVIVSLHRIMWQPVVPTDTFSFSLSSTTHFCVYVFSGEIFYILLFFIVVEKCYFFRNIWVTSKKKKKSTSGVASGAPNILRDPYPFTKLPPCSTAATAFEYFSWIENKS